LTVRRVVSGLLVCACALAWAATAGASPNGVVISEFRFRGPAGGNDEFVELTNAGGAPVTISGWKLQGCSSTTGAASDRATVPAGVTLGVGEHYLFVNNNAAGGYSGTVPGDRTFGTGFTDGAGARIVDAGASVIDGVSGTLTAASECREGAGIAGMPTTNGDQSFERKVGGTQDTGDNATDFTGPKAGNPQNHVVGDTAPSISTTSPQAGATGVARDSDITITFSEPVTVSGDWFAIQCATSGAHTATSSGGPTTYTLDPAGLFAANESCTVTVRAANVTDVDTVDPPNTMAGDASFSFTTVDLAVCGDAATPISRVQGPGATTPMSGQVVTVEGVVVADLQGTGQFSGYYLQEEPADADADPLTSEGIFVFNTATPVAAGDVVRVRGRAIEFSGQTQIDQVSSVIACASGATVPTTDVSLPFEAAGTPERYEGMLVRLPQALVISEYFNYERFGELVLARPLDGESRPFTPTSIVDPGGPALARLLANNLSRITLDDGLNSQNPSFLRHPNGAAFSLENRFRGGDTVTNTVGVLGFGFSLYRIQPTAPAQYTATNPRPAAPSPVGGSVRVAAMNTLNYFITPDNIQEPGSTDDPADNICGPVPSLECRGWDGDQPTELSRQRTKLLEALAGLEADVLGLNELENTKGVDVLTDPANGIVPGLNAKLGAGTYAAIETGTIGTDAIRVGLIYKPAKVTPVGSFKLLTSAVDPRFIDTKSRPALAQTFESLENGARFTVVVNHLKSKGSDCNDVGDPDTGDGQGNCNKTRTAAAQALVDWVKTDPTGSGDADFLIMGDLNSYAKEDPIRAIQAGSDDTAGTADDWTNLVDRELGTYAYSYVFDGMAGYLDHALGNASISSQVAGVAEWHINADEPDVLDYDTTFKPPAQDALYEPNAYRTSDHDPVLVGLDLAATFADLRRLTAAYVDHNGIENSLLAKLAAAERAAERGNEEAKQGSLGAFVNEVEAQTGKALTAEQAEQLIRIARSL